MFPSGTLLAPEKEFKNLGVRLMSDGRMELELDQQTETLHVIMKALLQKYVMKKQPKGRYLDLLSIFQPTLSVMRHRS